MSNVNSMNVFDKFTEHSKKALETAYFLAAKNCCDIDIEHILLGISKEKGCLGYDVLEQLHFQPMPEEKAIPQNTLLKKKKIDFSETAINLLDRAAYLAHMHQHPYIGTEHILYSILSHANEKIQNLFHKDTSAMEEIKNRLKLVLNSTSKFPHISNMITSPSSGLDDLNLIDLALDTQKKPILDFFATNLQDKKIQKNIDPVIGREDEIGRIIQILSRRTKNNPLLLGDPGVGKTAIVEGLAKKIFLKEVPPALLNKKIYSLDLGLLIAGSSFRGEFEQRLKQIIAHIKRDSDIIVFIDEIHNIIGAGSAMGAMDAANILKPSLARGEFRLIGATTMEEYKKNIENDAAFERRFQVVHISEPNIQNSIEILHGIKGSYEKFHRVAITDSAIKTAVKLSHRYIQEKFLPDKAIDLIDEAASAIKIQKHRPELEQNIYHLENEYNKIIELKKQAVANENYDSALNLRSQEDRLLEKISELKNALEKDYKKIDGEITEKEIKEIISKITGVPMEDLDGDGKTQLLSLEKKLSEKIIGQTDAIHTVSQHVKKALVGLSDPRRPLGSFIFLGPSGAGKTYLAKTLAQILFNDPVSFIRLDMSEYSEAFTISKLIGSPAGYVGYKDMNNLTDRVKKRPYSLVLFDEIEKAHPQIFHLLLQILEDGHCTDASGKTVHFKNTIIIMTSNIGSNDFHKTMRIGFDDNVKKSGEDAAFEDVKKNVLEKLSKFFSAEFLNRIDASIVFKPLGIKTIEKIAELGIKELSEKLMEKNVKVEYSPSVIQYIAKISFTPNLGARAIRKNISEYIEYPLAEKLLSENTNHIHIGVKNGKIVIE